MGQLAGVGPDVGNGDAVGGVVGIDHRDEGEFVVAAVLAFVIGEVVVRDDLLPFLIDAALVGQDLRQLIGNAAERVAGNLKVGEEVVDVQRAGEERQAELEELQQLGIAVLRLGIDRRAAHGQGHVVEDTVVGTDGDVDISEGFGPGEVPLVGLGACLEMIYADI